jgi:hypothetical protein
LLVVNGGRPDTHNNISWLDMESGRLLHTVDLDNSAPKTQYAHIDMSFDHWLFVLGILREDHETPIVFVSPEGEVFRPSLPPDILKRITLQALSGAFLGQSGLVAVTVPSSDMVLLLDYKTQALVEVITLPHPMGVIASRTADAKPGMLVSSHHQLFSMDAKFKMTVMRASAKFGGNGSHVTRMYV